MKKINIALISGGISPEREVSLSSGNQVFEALDKDKYNVFRYDPKNEINRLAADAANIDAALVILHGHYGEDGTVQGMLELLGIPYQGSGVLGSAVSMNKLIAKKIYEKSGIPVPKYMAFDKKTEINAEQCIKKIGQPIVVKPVESGSSVGMSIVKDKNDLQRAVNEAFEYDSVFFLEEYIKGIEITGGVLGNQELEALPLIEIIPNKEHDFFNYHAKYQPGATQEICPARISDFLTKKAQSLSLAAHKVLCCSGYSRTDMIIKEDSIYVLETNTIPGMTQTSLFPQAAKAAGYSFSELLDKLIELGIERFKN